MDAASDQPQQSQGTACAVDDQRQPASHQQLPATGAEKPRPVADDQPELGQRALIATIVTELSFLTLQRRNAVGDASRHKSVPHRPLKIGRRASRTACDAERRTIVVVTELSFLTLQRRNAVGDVPLHKSVPRRPLKIGRRASRLHATQS
ncbi:Uncharacterized protein ALO60_05739, partial [Pseudomonas amygdali pv. tabaci]